MRRSALTTRSLELGVLVFLYVGLRTAAVGAAQATVTTREASVRTAPFKVAPEVARVHAGDKLGADDQPQGEWRRVRLPDGRYGFLPEADAHVVADPAPIPTATKASPTAAPAAVPAPEPSAGPAAPAALGSTPPAAPPAVASVAQPTVLTEQQPAEPPPTTGPHQLGVMFELLPVGTLSASAMAGDTTVTGSNDSVFALAVAPFVDFAASPYFTAGVSPQVIFRVKADGSASESSKEFDLRARFTGRVPMSPRVRVFARLSPAYSIISLPAPRDASTTTLHDPAGFLVDFSVGAEVALLPNLFLVSDLGYQSGFQETTDDVSLTTLKFRTSYLHLGAGLAIGL